MRLQHLVRFRIVIRGHVVLHSNDSSRARLPSRPSVARRRLRRVVDSRPRVHIVPTSRATPRRSRLGDVPPVRTTPPRDRAMSDAADATKAAKKPANEPRSVNERANEASSADRPWWRDLKLPRLSLHDKPVYGLKISKVRRAASSRTRTRKGDGVVGGELFRRRDAGGDGDDAGGGTRTSVFDGWRTRACDVSTTGGLTERARDADVQSSWTQDAGR